MDATDTTDNTAKTPALDVGVAAHLASVLTALDTLHANQTAAAATLSQWRDDALARLEADLNTRRAGVLARFALLEGELQAAADAKRVALESEAVFCEDSATDCLATRFRVLNPSLALCLDSSNPNWGGLDTPPALIDFQGWTVFLWWMQGGVSSFYQEGTWTTVLGRDPPEHVSKLTQTIAGSGSARVNLLPPSWDGSPNTTLAGYTVMMRMVRRGHDTETEIWRQPSTSWKHQAYHFNLLDLEYGHVLTIELWINGVQLPVPFPALHVVAPTPDERRTPTMTYVPEEERVFELP